MEKIKECVGCGCCCFKAPCIFSLRKNGYIPVNKKCPELFWNGERYICLLAENDADIAKGLFVGEGCCMPLNSWRLNVIDREGV